MTIAIDASRLTSPHPTGVEVYCYEIIRSLLELSDIKRGNHIIKLYTPQPLKNIPEGLQVILPWRFKFWTQLRLSFELLVHPPDVFFSPGYTIPFLFLLNRRTKKNVTVHDIAFMREPRGYSVRQRLFLKITTRQAIKYAHKIITPTAAVKQDLVEYFNYPANKITVTHFGYNSSQQSTVNSRQSRQKQILYIGRIEAKKNITNLILAFNIFNQKYPDYRLTLAGKPGVGFNKIEKNLPRAIPPLQEGEGVSQSHIVNNIKYLGYITPEQKEQLLNRSTAFTFLSREEGFGFPLLESFAHNLPILSSDIPALREVGADACLFVDPASVSGIATRLEQIINDQDLRQKLIQNGQARLKDFSWQKCAQKTWEVLIS